MKNKEIEELLNKVKNAIKKHREQDYADDMLVILEFDVIQWNLLLSYIEQLEEEIQKKEAMYDSLAVDYRLSQEQNEQLENNRDKAIEYVEIELSQGGERELRDLVDGYEVLKLLKGDSDE